MSIKTIKVDHKTMMERINHRHKLDGKNDLDKEYLITHIAEQDELLRECRKMLAHINKTLPFKDERINTEELIRLIDIQLFDPSVNDNTVG